MKLKIFVLAFTQAQFDKIPDAEHLVKVNLTHLPLGEFQNNQLCEHRIFLSDLPESEDCDYVGFVTWRWFEKFGHLIPLENLAGLELKEDTIYAPDICDIWYTISLQYHPGMGKYLNELSAVTGIELKDTHSFYCNNFICHKSVYLKWQAFFRRHFLYFHNRYNFNYDFYTVDAHKPRQSGEFYERLSCLYFGNLTNINILPIPKNETFSCYCFQ